jgi:hypothetical protein
MNKASAVPVLKTALMAGAQNKIMALSPIDPTSDCNVLLQL